MLGKLLKGKNDGMSNFFLSTPTSLQVLSLSNICTTAVYLDENRNENILYLSLFPKAQWRFVYSFFPKKVPAELPKCFTLSLYLAKTS